jgi:cytochrome c-type biogenesis protein CcmH/NrfF
MEVKRTKPSNNRKYSEEMIEKTVKFILDSGKSATSIAEELVDWYGFSVNYRNCSIRYILPSSHLFLRVYLVVKND